MKLGLLFKLEKGNYKKTLAMKSCLESMIPSSFFQFIYSSFYNLKPAISRVLIGRHLIFCSPTGPTHCNLPQKCTPVKYKAR